MKETGKQIAALPLKLDKSGLVQVLMITSRETGRWVLPKGWSMPDKKPWVAAKIEALEEAGAEGRIVSESIGAFSYDKILSDGSALRCRVQVYPMLVENLGRDWKEKSERKREWFSPEAASKLVHEPELKELLLDLGTVPDILSLFATLREVS